MIKIKLRLLKIIIGKLNLKNFLNKKTFKILQHQDLK